jgi:serine/threonine-protein kinase RsbW
LDIDVRLSLPRDAISVPVIRRILRVALVTLRVHDDCVSDIEIALTEACTNVLDHARTGDSYEVVASVHADRCVIDVIDNGDGFDAAPFGLIDADVGAEEGRGIQLIRALVDNVRFVPVPGRGSAVHFEKSLVTADGSPLRQSSSSLDRGVVDTRDSIVSLHGEASRGSRR